MIRKFSLWLLLICVSRTALAQQNTDKQMDRLKDTVRLVVHGWIEPSGKRQILTATTYNRKGQEIEVVRYATDPFKQERSPHDKVVSTFVGLIKTERAYSLTKPSQNRLPAVVGIVVNGKVQPPPPPPPQPVREPDGAILHQTLYKLDGQGNWAEKIWYKGRVKVSPIISRYVYHRNEKGFVAEELVYEKDGSLSTRIVHKYDDQEIELEYAEYDVNDKLRMKNTFSDFKLDQKGNWIARTVKMFYVRSDGTPVNTGQNEYREISYYPASR